MTQKTSGNSKKWESVEWLSVGDESEEPEEQEDEETEDVEKNKCVLDILTRVGQGHLNASAAYSMCKSLDRDTEEIKQAIAAQVAQSRVNKDLITEDDIGGES